MWATGALFVFLALVTCGTSEESTECLSHVDLYKTAFDAQVSWALEMFDSATKIPDGILYGNIIHLGNFDECIKISVNNDEFTGRWCRVALTNASITLREDALPNSDLMLLPLQHAVNNAAKSSATPRNAYLPPGTPFLQWAVCAPSSCHAEAVAEVVTFNMQQLGLTVNAELLEKTCFAYGDSEFELDAAFWGWIALLIVLVCLAVVSTVYEQFVIIPSGEKPRHVAFVACSLRKNLIELFHVPRRVDPSTLGCLHGIRVMSMAWVIMGHRFYIQFYMPNINTIDLYEYTEQWSNMVIVNSFLSVETFFLLSGLLASYVACCGAQRGRAFNFMQYYINRYVRLTVPLAFYLFFVAAVSSKITHGPLWDLTIIPEANGCRERWWTALLYVNNYVDDIICGGQTWYLSVDMQLSWLAPILIWPLLRWPKPTLIVTCLLALGSTGAIFGITYVNELFWTNPVGSDNSTAYNFWKNIYRQTPLRAVPYLCGIALGYALSRVSRWRDSVPTWGWIVGWLVNTTVALATIFTLTIGYQKEYNVLDASFYGALHRLAWSLSISFIIVACVSGHGGPVNKVLSWRGFFPLSKLTYCAFLTHYILVFMNGGSWRNPHYFSNFGTIHAFFGDVFYTFLPSLALYLLVEAPSTVLLRNLLGKDKPAKRHTDEELVTSQENKSTSGS